MGFLSNMHFGHCVRSRSMTSSAQRYTAISRKVVGKNVHATIPKGNMGYNQYTVPDECSCRSFFCCFPLALANTFPWPVVPILSNFFKKQRTQNHPQCLSRLPRALFPTTFLEIAVYSCLLVLLTSEVVDIIGRLFRCHFRAHRSVKYSEHSEILPEKQKVIYALKKWRVKLTSFVQIVTTKASDKN